MDNDRKPVQHTARDTQHGTSNVQSSKHDSHKAKSDKPDNQHGNAAETSGKSARDAWQNSPQGRHAKTDDKHQHEKSKH